MVYIGTIIHTSITTYKNVINVKVTWPTYLFHWRRTRLTSTTACRRQ